MKLNKFIYEKLKFLEATFKSTDAENVTSDDIEKWIVDWYRSSFNEVGCDGDIPKPRMPPSWLANWRTEWEQKQKK